MFCFSALEDRYKKCGWNVVIFTRTAVSNKDGNTKFFSDNDMAHLEWGGTIIGILHFTNLLRFISYLGLLSRTGDLLKLSYQN